MFDLDICCPIGSSHLAWQTGGSSCREKLKAQAFGAKHCMVCMEQIRDVASKSYYGCDNHSEARFCHSCTFELKTLYRMVPTARAAATFDQFLKYGQRLSWCCNAPFDESYFTEGRCTSCLDRGYCRRCATCKAVRTCERCIAAVQPGAPVMRDKPGADIKLTCGRLTCGARVGVDVAAERTCTTCMKPAATTYYHHCKETQIVEFACNTCIDNAAELPAHAKQKAL